MKELAGVISEIAAGLHPERAMSLSLELSKSTMADTGRSVRSILSSVVVAPLIDELLVILSVTPDISCRDVGIMLAAASAASKQEANIASSVELVWTGPDTGLVPIRQTEQVLTGLIDEAKNRLFVVSFVAYRLGPVIEGLQRAVSRGVQLRILLEQFSDRGGSVRTDSMKTLNSNVPQAIIYEWNRDLHTKEGSASVHAKCAVADGRLAFVTSANLTEAAMERNMELGVLLRGGPTPQILENHLLSLVDTKQVRPIAH